MHGLSAIALVLKYLLIGGHCRLFSGVGLARTFGAGVPAVRAWAATAWMVLMGSVPPFLSNLVSNIVLEMGHQRHHTK